jgi:phosphoglucosamine mutase
VTIAFGTDGIRGPAGRFPIVPEVARAVGRAAVAEAANGVVLVGRDTRVSGEPLEQEVVAGIVAAGGTARRAGIVPTAALQVALAEGLGGAGVMVTASHNAGADNGFKVLLARGRKPDDRAAAAIAALLDAAPQEAGRSGTAEDAGDLVRSAWAASVRSAAGDLSALEGRQIAIDLANGAATAVRGLLAPWIPGDIRWIGTGGEINDGCGTEHLGHLAAVVARLGLDGGFAVDGDADRCRIVDGSGQEVSGDAVGWRLAQHLGVSGIAVTVMSSGALEALLPGVEVVRTPVGDRHVRVAMDERGLALGAEESGHVLFADHAGGDGLLTGLKALAAAWSAAPDLTRAFAGFVALPRAVRSVPVARRPPLASVARLHELEARAIDRLGAHGRTLLRYSGTEPVLRILVEGTSASATQALADELARAARAELG